MDTTYSRKEIRKEIFALILPIIMENVFQVSASLVTVAMIGRLSPLDISAQGIVMRITETLNSLFRGVAIGSTVYIAKAYGAKSMDQCFKVFKQTLISAVPMAILFGSVLFALPTQFLRILTDSSELLTVGAGYMRLTVMGLPFVAIMALVTSAFQGHSNTKTPMMIAMLVNISNIVLGYVLIFGVGGIGGFGIYGAAAALTWRRQSVQSPVWFCCLKVHTRSSPPSSSRKRFSTTTGNVSRMFIPPVFRLQSKTFSGSFLPSL